MTRTESDAPLALRRILVALDADALASNAIPAACRLARESGARVEFVHAVEPPGPVMQVVEALRAIPKGGDVLAGVRDVVVSRVRHAFEEHGVTDLKAEEVVDVVSGRPASAILSRAIETKADLIVLGALRGRKLVDFGSTARAILAHAPCAIWVQPSPVTPIRTILVPYDMSDESRRARTTACELARRSGAKVRVIHVFDSSAFLGGLALDGVNLAEILEERSRAVRREFEEHMTSADWNGVAHEHEFVDGSPADTIHQAERAADLVVMGTHGLTGLSAALIGSVTYSVLKHATRPVLVVREPQRRFSHG